MKQLGRPRRRWEDTPNIKIDLKEIEYEGVDWIHLAEYRTNSGLLWRQYGAFGFHKRRGNSWL